jgi:2-polyprenyl-3-methyl-5-hydroxy-6-metoxy-1,4-benzoquinol methylase
MDDRDLQGLESGKRPAWRTSLNFDEQDASHYLDYVNPGIFDLIDGSPRRVLELGCAGGMFGATLKQRFPGAEVIGIEAGRAAAERAATRLDRVVHARIEGVDFEAEKAGWGEFDTVIAADILEHLVNPWDLLLRLKRRLAPGAQVVASIPNVRNIWLVSRLLLGGRWEYGERGLLDITHLRFFTLEEIRRLFAETGYVVEAHGMSILPSLRPIYATYQGRGAKVLKLGRLTLEDVTPEELTEFCAEQFFVRCRAA